MMGMGNRGMDGGGCIGEAVRLDSGVDRRRLLRLAACGVTAAGLVPLRALAQAKTYKAKVLACIDPRLQKPVWDYLAGRRLTGEYSQFTIAGAAIGAVAPRFSDWHKTFWDNLGTSIELHSVPTVIVINHRDCGAARVAYGDAAIADRATETRTHREVFAQFRRELARHHPNLNVETLLMDLDGKYEVMG